MARLHESFEAGAARGMLALPAALLRLMAGKPVVRDGQTLDVQCQLLLKIMRMRGVRLGGGDVEQQRRQMVAQSRTLAPRARGPIAVRDLVVAGAEGALAARAYRPEGADGAAILFYHGGGFVLGDLESHDGVCRALADRTRATVIAVDYRRAPEHGAPAAPRDAIAAFRDIVNRADNLGLDARQIAVAGDSAGANLAAVVAQQAKGDAKPPCAQLLFYPVVDFAEDKPSKDRLAEGFFLEKASMDWFEERYLPAGCDKRDPMVSPLYGELAGAAPAIVITAGFDPLRDEGEAYAAALKTAGVDTVCRRETGLLHGFANFAGGVERANEALTHAANDLRARLTAAV
ncbi:alpha/beta hydrolase [Salinisphaera hydrothermalis]|uniref:Esterase n=1 Tax=Salinisphaera hydrothermalis (strain C41B8) TaxID=1304275 RepID=A0A084IQF2_SALHC|nr:alpha/beta hydrolase [Salinisphaera hydrothermalis]KEZ78936.1 esterase [Salinisphaera hydrothermalis C41B8]